MAGLALQGRPECQRVHPGVRHLLRGELWIRQDDQAADSGAQVRPAVLAPAGDVASTDVCMCLWHRRKVFLRHADGLAVTFILTFLHPIVVPALFLDSFSFCWAAAKWDSRKWAKDLILKQWKRWAESRNVHGKCRRVDVHHLLRHRCCHFYTHLHSKRCKVRPCLCSLLTLFRCAGHFTLPAATNT